MSVLRFRCDRRRRDPFAAAPAAAPEAPARTLEQPHPAYESRMDVDATFAGLVAQASAAAEAVRQQEAERERLRPPGASADPRASGYVPSPDMERPGGQARPPWTTAPQPQLQDQLAREANDWYGWNTTVLDVPPHHDRPYIPGVLGSDGRLSPRSAGVSEDLAGLVLFRFSVERMTRPCCEQCGQAAGDWRERLYGTFRHHTRPVDAAAPRQFGIATELRQAHEGAAAAADRAERAFAERYLTRRAA